MNCFGKVKGKMQKGKVKTQQTPCDRFGWVDFGLGRPFAFYLFTFSF